MWKRNKKQREKKEHVATQPESDAHVEPPSADEEDLAAGSAKGAAVGGLLGGAPGGALGGLFGLLGGYKKKDSKKDSYW